MFPETNIHTLSALLDIKTFPHTIIKQKLTNKDGATSFSC